MTAGMSSGTHTQPSITATALVIWSCHTARPVISCIYPIPFARRSAPPKIPPTLEVNLSNEVEFVLVDMQQKFSSRLVFQVGIQYDTLAIEKIVELLREQK